MPVFYPADPQDMLDLGRHAVELPRASGVWAAMKVVTNVADAACTAVVQPGWRPPRLGAEGAYSQRPSSRLLGVELAKLERSRYTVRMPLVHEYLRTSAVNRISGRPSDRIGIVAAGKSYLDVCQALRILGLDQEALARSGIRLLKLGVIHPLEPTVIREFADGLSEILVVEEKRAFVEVAVKELLYGRVGAPAQHRLHNGILAA